MLGLDTGLDVRAGAETRAREEDLTDVEALLRLRLTLDVPRLADLPRLTELPRLAEPPRLTELPRLAELPRLDLPPPPRPLFAKTGSTNSIRTKTTVIKTTLIFLNVNMVLLLSLAISPVQHPMAFEPACQTSPNYCYLKF